MRLVCLLLFFSFVGYGQNPCLPATGYSYLDMNNVTALIENSGSLFKNNNYKVKGETLSSYSGIWIGCLEDKSSKRKRSWRDLKIRIPKIKTKRRESWI